MSQINLHNKFQQALGSSANGNTQSVKSPEQIFYEVLVGTLYGKDKYYTKTSDIVVSLREATAKLVARRKMDFLANVIVHARTVMHMRTIPVIATIIAADEARKQKVDFPQLRYVVEQVIQRADQLTDFIAAALDTFGNKKMIPRQVRSGVADAFGKFNEYQFGKYNTSAAVKLKDVLRIVHPKPATAEQSQVYKKIVDGTLETPYTWETQLSDSGKTGRSKADVWTELVNSGKVGYMALLRNLRNILAAGVSQEIVAKVCARISAQKEVLASKQLPYAYVNAYEQLLKADAPVQVLTAVSDALEISCANVPSIGDNVWIIVDGSGSMFGGEYRAYMSKRDFFSLGSCPIKTAAIFAAALFKQNNGAKNIKLSMFSDDAFFVNLNPRDSVMTLASKILEKVAGGGTNLNAALQQKPSLGFEPDAVVLFSDMEVDSLTGSAYQGRFGRNTSVPNIAKIFQSGCVKVAVNLDSGETTPVGERDGFIQLAGFSEKLFQLIPAIREAGTIAKVFDKPFCW